MKSALDSSVIVSALCADDHVHKACREVLLSARHSILAHALTETFSTLTGGRLGFRVQSSAAADLLRNQVVPRLHTHYLDADGLLAAFDEAEARGIRGGAIYDYLHLAAARHAGVERFYTLNLSDFLSFHRPGDPIIVSP